MGWAARNKYKGNQLGLTCTKCYGTGIRGYKIDPFRKTRQPIQCKCTLKKVEPDSPVSQLAEEADLESVQ